MGVTQEVQIGASLLRSYYISINIQNKVMLFSPLNRFSPEITTAEIIRFLSIFLGFMFGACICIVVWQKFNMPPRQSSRFSHGKEGFRLVAYQRPP